MNLCGLRPWLDRSTTRKAFSCACALSLIGCATLADKMKLPPVDTCMTSPRSQPIRAWKVEPGETAKHSELREPVEGEKNSGFAVVLYDGVTEFDLEPPNPKPGEQQIKNFDGRPWRTHSDAFKARFGNADVWIVRAPPGKYSITNVKYPRFGSTWNLGHAFDFEVRPASVTLLGGIECINCSIGDTLTFKKEEFLTYPGEKALQGIVDMVAFRAAETNGNSDDVAMAKSWLAEVHAAWNRRAANPMETSCLNGDAESCTGLGAQKDAAGQHADAMHYYQLACDAGDTKVACMQVAGAFDSGTPRDPVKARTMYERACRSRGASACNNLAAMFLKGDGGPKNEACALAVTLDACDDDDWGSCSTASLILAKGNAGPPNGEDALARASRSCDHGDTGGCDVAGNILYTGMAGVTKNVAASVPLFEKACNLKGPHGCSDLGDLYADGIGVAKDSAKAISLYQTGCDGRDSYGCQQLSDSYLTGKGVPKDEAKATQLRKMACDLGRQASCAAAAPSAAPAAAGN